MKTPVDKIQIGSKVHIWQHAARECVCGWKEGDWGCSTFGEHIGRIIDDRSKP